MTTTPSGLGLPSGVVFTQLAERQSVVVNSILDWAERGVAWRAFFLHAEFGDDGASLIEAFLVLSPPDPDKPHSVPTDAAICTALVGLHAAYREAGQGFTQLDLTVVPPDGRYRFELGYVPSLRLSGARDPDASAHLGRRYQQILKDLGLDTPPPAPPVQNAADTAKARGRSVRPVTAANLATAIATETASSKRYLACAARADVDGRPRIAALFRAAARGDDVRAQFHRRLIGEEAKPSSGPAVVVGTTLENVVAAIDAETVAAAELYARMMADETGKAQDIFYFAKAGAEGRASLFGLALGRLNAGSDLGGTDPYFVCTLCGAVECSHTGTCFTCEISTELVAVS
jgi:rubrerythrin